MGRRNCEKERAGNAENVEGIEVGSAGGKSLGNIAQVTQIVKSKGANHRYSCKLSRAKL
jgi:hypothetical protein